MISLQSALGALLLGGLSASHAVDGAAPALRAETFAAPPVSWARAAGSSAFPQTVEEYWTGRGQCLTSPAQIDDRARTSLALLERYSEPATRRVGELRFEQRPGILIEAFRELTSEMPSTTMAPVASDCRTVHCAVGRIFGDKQGLRLLHLMVRYRYNASHLADRHAVPWTEQELGDILLALEDLPAASAPFYDQTLRPLVREAEYERLESLSGDASGGIVAISSPSNNLGIRTSFRWPLMRQHHRRAALFHELAHDFLRQQRELIDADAVWAKAMAADQIFREKTARPRSSVSRYAGQSLDEDFAESVVAYRYAPELMKGRTPNRARLLSIWYFDGLSYDSSENCDPQRALTLGAAKQAIATLPSHRLSDRAVNAAVRQCQRLLQNDESRHRVTHGRLCIGREIYRDALAKELQGLIEPGGQLTKAVVEGRRANNPFLQETFGSIGDERIMALTNRKAMAACGKRCHN